MNNQTSSPNFYANIPATVRYDEDLPLGARLLYGEISALCNQHGYCWASNGYFSNLYNKSQRTISRWISSLEENGHIFCELKYKEGTSEVEGRFMKLNLIKLTESSCPLSSKTAKTPLTKMSTPPDKNVHTPLTKMSIPYGQKCLYPPDKNVYYNTTLNNTINNTINKKDEIENLEGSIKKENVKIDLKNFALKESAEVKKNPLPPPKFPEPLIDYLESGFCPDFFWECFEILIDWAEKEDKFIDWSLGKFKTNRKAATSIFNKIKSAYKLPSDGNGIEVHVKKFFDNMPQFYKGIFELDMVDRKFESIINEIKSKSNDKPDARFGTREKFARAAAERKGNPRQKLFA